ncbi:MAG: hypothetical protein EOO73_23395 [Myxococcales bacterium]|nr:MAG: hypothetical protein EOO73_23395 [Myxococcales bacterium]
MLKIHELVLPSGELAAVFLRADEAALELTLVSDDSELQLPEGALRAVMLRYGSPFDPEARSTSHGTLELANGASLRHVRHLAGYDVIARDYLVYAEPGLEPVCAMATTVAGALRHLGLAARLR